MTTTRRSLGGEKRRSDLGSYDYTKRDDRLLRIAAEMTFISFDHLSQFAAPGFSPATDPPPLPKNPSSRESEELRQPAAKKKRGGKRDNVPWPQDRKKRLHALAEIVRRWETKMGYAEVWKPWEDGPTWVRVTQAGLATLGLDWNEIPFPKQRNRLTTTSHTYQVNRRRLALATGSASPPDHLWISERSIYADQYKQGIEVERAHRPDGVLLLKADGSYPLQRGNTVIEEIPLQADQRIAVEVELSRKRFARLGEGILPSLLSHYDFVWYFCGNDEVYQTVIRARRDYLTTNGERKRIRILLLEERIEEEGEDE